METTIWQNYPQDEVVVVGIINTSNHNQLNNFIEENSLSFPILFDPGSSGGVQGGDTYNDYYMPNDGSPYPRDFIVDKEGILRYANNEIDTEWMHYVLNELISLKIKSDYKLSTNYMIYPNYPNPFNPFTTLRYYLPENEVVNITIYDSMGKIVITLVNNLQDAGNNIIRWNSRNNKNQIVSAGLYFYTIQIGNFRETRKMVLLK